RIGEIDLDLDARTVVGPEFGKGFAELDADRLVDLQVTALGGEMGDAGLVDGVEERLGAAVHHGHFRPVDLDHDIVDGQRPQRRHQVLDGGHRYAAETDGRAQLG